MIAILDSKHKVFVIYIATFNINLVDKVYPLKKAQIAYLKADEAFIKVLSKYADFTDIFLPKLTKEFFKHMGINNHTIELVDDLPLSCGPIYSLSLVKLGILKTNIKNNLANGFIRPSKFFVVAFIFFDKKLDENLWLCIEYQGCNNLTIKNYYPLLLVKKLLD